MADAKLPARFTDHNVRRILARAYDAYRGPPPLPLAGAEMQGVGFPLWIRPELGRSAEVMPFWGSRDDIDAAGLLMRRFVTGRHRTMLVGCLYILSSEGPFCKIGISSDPFGRLAAISTSSPYKLDIAALVWVSVGAGRLEKDVLQALKSDGIKVVGEWAHTTADHALERALLLAEERGWLVAPADLMLRGLIRGHVLSDPDGVDGGDVKGFVAEQFSECAVKTAWDAIPRR